MLVLRLLNVFSYGHTSLFRFFYQENQESPNPGYVPIGLQTSQAEWKVKHADKNGESNIMPLHRELREPLRGMKLTAFVLLTA